MSLRTKVALAAAAMIAVPGVLFVATVSAHATIGSAAWNDASNPTKVIATSRGDDISSEAGTYSLKVYDPSGKEITAGATVLTGPKTMEVAVSKPAAQGQYRVAWTTKSAEPDGHSATGNVSLQLNAVASAPAPAASTPATASPIAPPATGDGGLLTRVTTASRRCLLASWPQPALSPPSALVASPSVSLLVQGSGRPDPCTTLRLWQPGTRDMLAEAYRGLVRDRTMRQIRGASDDDTRS